MPQHLLVGNDIIDLRDRRCPGKSRDLRFVSRICHPEEASRILSAPDADTELWLHWAAKESAYKVTSKRLGAPPVFEHAAFRVHVDHLLPGGADRMDFNASGTVDYQDEAVPFRASINSGRIHVVAWSATGEEEVEEKTPNSDLKAGIETGEAHVHTAPHDSDGGAGEADALELLMKDRFTQRERRSIHSPPSAHVRLFARSAMADSLKIDERRLEVLCGEAPTGRTPPRVLLDGKSSVLDVTMSHHGEHVAWAFANVWEAGVDPA